MMCTECTAVSCITLSCGTDHEIIDCQPSSLITAGQSRALAAIQLSWQLLEVSPSSSSAAGCCCKLSRLGPAPAPHWPARPSCRVAAGLLRVWAGPGSIGRAGHRVISLVTATESFTYSVSSSETQCHRVSNKLYLHHSLPAQPACVRVLRARDSQVKIKRKPFSYKSSD